MEVRPIDAHVAEVKLIEILASAMAKRKTVYDASDALIEVVRSDSPTLDYAPVKHGEWGKPEIVGYDGVRAVYAVPCSVCGKHTREYLPYYCHNCGAKMDGGGKDG